MSHQVGNFGGEGRHTNVLKGVKQKLPLKFK